MDQNTPLNPRALFTLLDEADIAHTTYTHPPIFTVEQGKDIKSALPGGHTKNLFLKDKSGALFLICALAHTKIPLNKLHSHLRCKRLSFGREAILFETLGVRSGSVTLFAILNDKTQRVTLVLDKALFDDPLVNFHPLKNTATTTIASANIMTVAERSGHTPLIIDFAHLSDAQSVASSSD